VESLFPAGVWHYLLGGLLIGAGVSWIFTSTGIVAGMSSVFSSSWSYISPLSYFQSARLRESRVWRLVLAFGLVLGATLTVVLLDSPTPVTSIPPWQLALGGLIAGFGARLSGGCTSGHGICGMASLQGLSMTAVLVFMLTAFITANLVQFLGGH
jgi:hypothetical protein